MQCNLSFPLKYNKHDTRSCTRSQPPSKQIQKSSLVSDKTEFKSKSGLTVPKEWRERLIIREVQQSGAAGWITKQKQQRSLNTVAQVTRHTCNSSGANKQREKSSGEMMVCCENRKLDFPDRKSDRNSKLNQ